MVSNIILLHFCDIRFNLCPTPPHTLHLSYNFNRSTVGVFHLKIGFYGKLPELAQQATARYITSYGYITDTTVLASEFNINDDDSSLRTLPANATMGIFANQVNKRPSVLTQLSIGRAPKLTTEFNIFRATHEDILIFENDKFEIADGEAGWVVTEKGGDGAQLLVITNYDQFDEKKHTPVDLLVEWIGDGEDGKVRGEM